MNQNNSRERIEEILKKFGTVIMWETEHEEGLLMSNHDTLEWLRGQLLLLEQTHHPELQKARDEERERIMRWTSSNYSRSTQPLYAHVDLLGLQNFIRQPDQSELDQPNK